MELKPQTLEYLRHVSTATLCTQLFKRGFRNVYIQGITLRGAQFWQFHPVLSRYVMFDGVATTNSGKGNNDGLDPESCDHVVVKNSSIKARDDAMAIKSGRDADGRRINVPTTNLVIVRTSMASSNWGMITLGSELSAGIRGVYAYDIKVDAGDRVKYVLELKGSSQRGGFATDIMSGMRMACSARLTRKWSETKNQTLSYSAFGRCPSL